MLRVLCVVFWFFKFGTFCRGEGLFSTGIEQFKKVIAQHRPSRYWEIKQFFKLYSCPKAYRFLKANSIGAFVPGCTLILRSQPHQFWFAAQGQLKVTLLSDTDQPALLFLVGLSWVFCCLRGADMRKQLLCSVTAIVS